MADASSLPPHTRRKFGETNFFLNHMVVETQKPEPGHDPEAFGYYLSAFLSAARSVTWVLQVEDQPGYMRIYQPWFNALSKQDQDLWRTMNEFRRIEVHFTGISVTAATTTAIVSLAEARPGVYTVSEIVALAPEFDVGGQPVKVIATCRRYVALLSDLLGRWT